MIRWFLKGIAFTFFITGVPLILVLYGYQEVKPKDIPVLFDGFLEAIPLVAAFLSLMVLAIFLYRAQTTEPMGWQKVLLAFTGAAVSFALLAYIGFILLFGSVG